jgi:hypothetical protein
MSTQKCAHCGLNLYIWQETWLHEPRGNRWCFDSPVAEPETAQQKLERITELWMQPVPANSFYINGFPDRLAQLADLYDEEIAAEMRSILTNGGAA